MNLKSMRAEFADLESDQTLLDEANLAARTKAIDFVDFLGEVVRVSDVPAEIRALLPRATRLRAQLVDVNERLFERTREQLRMSLGASAEVRRTLDRFTSYSPSRIGQPHFGYDGLDVLLDGVLRIDRRADVNPTQHPEMIHYEPTPARVILELVDRVPLTPRDVFYDLGSGLGQVVFMVRLLTGVTARGVEFQPSLCSQAERVARDLGLDRVDFINADARDASCADGTVFYLFTPFKGAMLQTVLDRLKQISQTRPITLCSYGSVTRHLFDQAWLGGAADEANHDYKLAIFRSIG